MSWGNKILIVFIAFGSMISFMVYRCMNTPVNLVSEQYYKDELAYQRVIDGTRAANALSEKVSVGQAGDGIRVRLPAEMRGRTVSGTIFFYCPSDMSRDRNVPIRMEGNVEQAIGRGLVSKGSYTVKVSWDATGVHYFAEQNLVIQ